ncbi:MAG: TlpA family protein disulfide reductase [Defluviitaleaceae bacterium]|nr:TlpA family protein disulfide reductase [Defluviitaleaceae bacterium]MCL2835749.1 TlpA family protein disulfide reductase [Defluviitaleaceae bacterium]
MLLNFWAAWCGPCVEKMPDLQKISEAFTDDVVVLAVNQGERRYRSEDFVSKIIIHSISGLTKMKKSQICTRLSVCPIPL